MKSTLQVVWFKRDLRIGDHEPLARAAKRGPVLPLYVVDPAIIHAPDFDSSHWTFIRASLIELRRRLFTVGQPLVVRTGDSVAILEAIHAQAPIGRIWAHEESGNAISRDRDSAVRKWAKERGVRFTELPCNGVARNNTSQNESEHPWEAFIRQPLVAQPLRLRPATGVDPGPIPDHTDLGLAGDKRTGAQHGGETLGHQTLATFLSLRGESYGQEASDESTLWEPSSRISPYLSWGNLSIRQAVHETRDRNHQVRALPVDDRGDWPRALAIFESRLRWRSNSVQEFEETPEMEVSNLDSTFDALDRRHVDNERFTAWSSGLTGYPLIDASMRAMLKSGWINFRMRSMLVSFASFDLWLPWRETGLHLARAFLDYEPGIHWLQMQILSGTSESSAIRVYNPTKQAQEQDPTGAYIKEWVPELAGVPVTFIHSPWLMPEEMQRASGCLIGRDYPHPIVDHLTATREAHQRMQDARRPPSGSETAINNAPHPIRSSQSKSRRSKKSDRDKPAQLSFPVE